MSKPINNEVGNFEHTSRPNFNLPQFKSGIKGTIQMSSRKSVTEINYKNRTLVSSDKLADLLKLSLYTIRDYYRTGKLPGMKIGRTIYFDLEKVEKALSIDVPPVKHVSRAKRKRTHDVTADM